MSKHNDATAWTSEPPKVAGRYWWKDDENLRLVHLGTETHPDWFFGTRSIHPIPSAEELAAMRAVCDAAATLTSMVEPEDQRGAPCAAVACFESLSAALSCLAAARKEGA